MPVCAECGYVTWEATICPQCANPSGAGPSVVVGGAERPSQSGMVLFALMFNFFTLPALDANSVAAPLVALGANLAAGVLWFRVGADQLRRNRRGASTVSSLMVGVSLLFAVGCLFVAAFNADPSM